MEITNPPTKEEIENFWRPIYVNDKSHNDNAQWIDDHIKYLDTLNLDEQQLPIWESKDVSEAIKKMSDWKGAGVDNLQIYWWKHFNFTHNSLPTYFSEILHNPETSPEWFTFARTTLAPKTHQATHPSKYRPISCLPTVYKIFSSMIAKAMKEHIDINNLIPEEQKGCASNSLGCIDQLLIDNMVLCDAKNNQKNLSMAWIDYAKAYDSIPHTWIVKCLRMYKFDPKLVRYYENAMRKWKLQLVLHHGTESTLSDTLQIKSGIFQGDSPSGLLFCISLIALSWLIKRTGHGYYINKGRKPENLISHLLFMDDLKLYSSNDNQLRALLETTQIFSNDIGMSFGLEKCAKISIIRGKVKNRDNIILSSGEEIRELNNQTFYKYLGVEENKVIGHTETKEKLSKEYFSRLRKILKSELNSYNMIMAINQWAVPAITYGFGIINWTKAELLDIDRKTRTLLKAYHVFHNKSNVEKLYLPRKDGGRGLLSIWKQFQKAIINIAYYLTKSELLFPRVFLEWDSSRGESSVIRKAETYANDIGLEFVDIVELNKVECKTRVKNSMTSKGNATLTNMPMHGQHHRLLQEEHIDRKTSLTWMKDSRLKGHTEAMVHAIQDQAVKTRYMEKNIYKTTENDKCRKCNEKAETIHHIISGCPKYANTLYLKRHNNVAKYLHLQICLNNDLVKKNCEWYKYEPSPVLENENFKILWDFSIQTDKEIRANRPDIIFVDKRERTVMFIDVTIPNDHNIIEKKLEKIEKYTDLGIEIKELWNMQRVDIVPIVIGCTGVVDNTFVRYLGKIPAEINVFELQKIVLLNTCYIVRRFLSTD